MVIWQVKEMLGNGFDPNIVNVDSKETILTTACKSRKSEVVRILLELGADANKNVDGGPTPLEHACVRNDIATIDVLLRNKANHNIENISLNPLCWAVKRQNYCAVEAIICYGALLNAKA